MIKFGESGPPVFLSNESVVLRNDEKQKRWKIIWIILCRCDTIESVFRAIISVNQLSIYGAVSNLCEECSICHTSTGGFVVTRQSDPLFEPARLLMTIPTPSTEVFAQENVLQKYQERVERLSQQDGLIKLCTDAGFLTKVEVGTVLHDKGH